MKNLFLLLLLFTASLTALKAQGRDSIVDFSTQNFRNAPKDGITREKQFAIHRLIADYAQRIEQNAAKNSVIDLPSILFATGNTPYAGKFVRENGAATITCFIDKQGVRHEINKKSPAAVGYSGVQVDASNPNSDFKGAFVKEASDFITAYVDAYGVRHAVGIDGNLYATKAKLKADSTLHANNYDYVNTKVDTKLNTADFHDNQNLTVSGQNLTISGGNTITFPTNLIPNNLIPYGSSGNIQTTDLNFKYAGTILSAPYLNAVTDIRINGGRILNRPPGFEFMLNHIGPSGATGNGNMGGGQNSLKSLTTGSDNIAFGVGAMQFNTVGGNSTVIGNGAFKKATGSSGTSVAVGSGALSEGTINVSQVGVGMNTLKNAGKYGHLGVSFQSTHNVAVGVNANMFCTNCDGTIVLGVSSNTTGTTGANIGIVDMGIDTSMKKTFIAGSMDWPVTEVYFGEGNRSFSPKSWRLRGTDGLNIPINNLSSANTIGVKGGDISIIAGRGTGALASGTIDFQTHDSSGVSGDQLRNTVVRMKITEDGNVYIPSSANGVVQKSGNGSCWKLLVSDLGAVSAVSIACPN